MVDVFSGSITGIDPDSTTVGESSQMISPFRDNRSGMIVVNLSGANISLAFEGTAAVINKGVTLLPNGGTWSMDEHTYSKGEVQAIAGAVDSALSIQEFIS